MASPSLLECSALDWNFVRARQTSPTYPAGEPWSCGHPVQREATRTLHDPPSLCLAPYRCSRHEAGAQRTKLDLSCAIEGPKLPRSLHASWVTHRPGRPEFDVRKSWTKIQRQAALRCRQALLKRLRDGDWQAQAHRGTWASEQHKNHRQASCDWWVPQ